MSAAKVTSIELAFATREKQVVLALNVAAGTSVAEAIERSPLAEIFPDEDFTNLATGIWGKPVSRQHRLSEGDRIEIYRPLARDPREARRELAAEGKTMGAAGKPGAKS